MALAVAEQHSHNASLGQNDLFGFGLMPQDDQIGSYLETEEWSEDHRLALEKEILGHYLSGHPIDCYEQTLRQIIPYRIAEILEQVSGEKNYSQQVIIAGLIEAVRTSKARQGGYNGFITVADQSARFEVKVFAEVFNRYQELLRPDCIVVIEGTLGWDFYTDSVVVTAEKIYSLAEAFEIFAKILEIEFDGTYGGEEAVRELAQILAFFRQKDGCPVAIHYRNKMASAHFMVGEEWRIKPNEELLSRLQSLLGTEHVCIKY